MLDTDGAVMVVVVSFLFKLLFVHSFTRHMGRARRIWGAKEQGMFHHDDHRWTNELHGVKSSTRLGALVQRTANSRSMVLLQVVLCVTVAVYNVPCLQHIPVPKCPCSVFLCQPASASGATGRRRHHRPWLAPSSQQARRFHFIHGGWQHMPWSTDRR